MSINTKVGLRQEHSPSALQSDSAHIGISGAMVVQGAPTNVACIAMLFAAFRVLTMFQIGGWAGGWLACLLVGVKSCHCKVWGLNIMTGH